MMISDASAPITDQVILKRQGELQSVIFEFLGLLYELQWSQAPHDLSVLETLLHLLTDIETQLALIRADLENNRLIYNDLQTKLLEEGS